MECSLSTDTQALLEQSTSSSIISWPKIVETLLYKSVRNNQNRSKSEQTRVFPSSRATVIACTVGIIGRRGYIDQGS